MSLNMENFTNYWGKLTIQTRAFKKKMQKEKDIDKKNFFQKFLAETKIKLTEQQIDKIVNLSKALEGNYLK